ncbi:MAG: cob(I)yrinic acid a,c-diamide adenosyltransferase [Phycisphaeraceae bacterium]|nr:cob(I)yrinic acid a,c-diamide adenosyltransferase [Phycisphaeraceae bacterium]
MKLYTKRGDDGLTDLFHGGRVPKDHLRVEAYGCVDELNSHLGLVLAAQPPEPIQRVVVTIQNQLFDVGSDLATPPRQDDSPVPRIVDDHVKQIESMIDAACAGLPEMKHFILPGGTEPAARLHVARTVARRAERMCVQLAREEPVGQPLLVYLNRLSDLLFALARQANHLAGTPDVPWLGRKGAGAE